MFLIDLPIELIVKILTYTQDYETVLNCLISCKGLFRAAQITLQDFKKQWTQELDDIYDYMCENPYDEKGNIYRNHPYKPYHKVLPFPPKVFVRKYYNYLNSRHCKLFYTKPHDMAKVLYRNITAVSKNNGTLNF